MFFTVLCSHPSAHTPPQLGVAGSAVKLVNLLLERGSGLRCSWAPPASSSGRHAGSANGYASACTTGTRALTLCGGVFRVTAAAWRSARALPARTSRLCLLFSGTLSTLGSSLNESYLPLFKGDPRLEGRHGATRHRVPNQLLRGQLPSPITGSLREGVCAENGCPW